MHTEVAKSVPETGQRHCESVERTGAIPLSPLPLRRGKFSHSTSRVRDKEGTTTVRGLPAESGCHERRRWTGGFTKHGRLSVALAGENREGVKYSVPQKGSELRRKAHPHVNPTLAHLVEHFLDTELVAGSNPAC